MHIMISISSEENKAHNLPKTRRISIDHETSSYFLLSSVPQATQEQNPNTSRLKMRSQMHNYI